MSFWLQLAFAWLVLSFFFAMGIGACIRAGKGDDGHLSSDDYWRDVQ